MKELYLRNVNNTYYKLDKARKYSCYHDPENNNLLVFSPCDDCTIGSVCDATVSPGAYEYLTNVLNTSKNVVIHWSEVSGTTSDYTIYRNLDVNNFVKLSHDEILKLLPESTIFMKFTEFRNGVQEKIEFPKISKSKRENKKDSKTITIGEWETEEEAAGAYNVLNLIFNGADNDEWNDVEISMRTFDRVMEELRRDGWSCNESELRWLKNQLRIKFGMKFLADA